jgi:hypothetical protein
MFYLRIRCLYTHDVVLMGSTEIADINLVSNATIVSGGRE